MTRLHINRGPGPDAFGPWERITDHPKAHELPESMVVDCCMCRMPVENIEVRIEQQTEPSYYEPIVEWRCRPGTGCDANPRRRIGRGNRAAIVEGW
jgi:hypothetical protein